MSGKNHITLRLTLVAAVIFQILTSCTSKSYENNGNAPAGQTAAVQTGTDGSSRTEDLSNSESDNYEQYSEPTVLNKSYTEPRETPVSNEKDSEEQGDEEEDGDTSLFGDDDDEEEDEEDQTKATTIRKEEKVLEVLPPNSTENNYNGRASELGADEKETTTIGKEEKVLETLPPHSTENNYGKNYENSTEKESEKLNSFTSNLGSPSAKIGMSRKSKILTIGSDFSIKANSLLLFFSISLLIMRI